MALIVETHELFKTFRYQKRGSGLRGWFAPEYAQVDAVKNLNLSIEAGERVAFIGPNGAGKSTTIKMLSGILTPSTGSIKVCGLHPIDQRQQLAYKIGCVFGQRSQLLPNLPLRDSFELFGYMYDLPKAQIDKRIDELIELFALGEFIEQPVRQLSLGQRMRGEIAANLLHKPDIIFLDEPTIGLDIVAKKQLRQTLIDLNEQHGTTIFLTSHDVGDIEKLSQRLVMIDHGQVMLDSPTDQVQKTFLSRKHIKITFDAMPQNVGTLPLLEHTWQDTVLEGVLDTEKTQLNQALQQLLALGNVADVQVFDASLEETLLQLYGTLPTNGG